MVNVSIVLPGMRFPRVGVDNAMVGRQAAAHFLERGLVNFGFIGPAEHQYSIERGGQFRLALLEAGYKVSFYHTPAEVPFDPHCQFWDLGRGVHRWLRALPKPVGVFVPADDWGLQASEACRQAGMRIPEDVALIGVDNDDLNCQLSRPRQSSVIVPSERIGYEAAALLDRLLAGNRPPAEPILLPSLGVVSRRSTDFLAIEDQEVASAMRFIREHAHEPLQVDDVVRVISLSRRMLEIRFQKSIGWGISKEIQRAHLELARRLLTRTKLPVSTVAIKAGFSDNRQLDVVFRKELGQSPSEYRRHIVR